MLLEEITPDENWRHPAELMDDDDDDDTEALDVSGIGTIPKNALAVFAEFILAQKRGGGINFKTTMARLIALCHTLNVRDLRKVSLTSLAEQIGCSRALLSIYEVELREFGKLSCHGGKSLSARESYAKAASAAWTRRRERGGQGEGPTVATRHGRTSCELGAS